MADGFIVRRGGKTTEQALAPTITEVSVTDSSITFTIKNNDTETATIVYRIDDLTAEGESISLAGGATSSNITASGLDPDETYTVFATANVTGKVKSNVTEKEIESGPAPVYTAATGGTTLEYDDGGKRYKSHTFTSNGTFTVTTVGDAIDDRNKVDYLILAGGAGGGSGSAGAGGGAGGYRTTIAPTPSDVTPNAKVTVTATSFGVTIGAGGNGAIKSSNTQAVSGGNSSVAFATTITSDGGGFGGSTNISPFRGANGGSGGGGTHSQFNGSVNTVRATGISGQGRNGGLGAGDPNFPGSGGGGAGQVGADASTTVAGAGGNGLANLLRTGSNETRAGGGGAGSFGGTSSSGGSGGGGNGGSGANGSGNNATVNTGSGGGGSGSTGGNIEGNGGNGAGGIVVIRYEIAPSV